MRAPREDGGLVEAEFRERALGVAVNEDVRGVQQAPEPREVRGVGEVELQGLLAVVRLLVEERAPRPFFRRTMRASPPPRVSTQESLAPPKRTMACLMPEPWPPPLR